MSELTLRTPDQLTQVVERLVLTATEKLDLNRRMANHARQFFRSQIRAQRDIDNNPYQSRTRRKRVELKDGTTAKNTVNNKNMLMGLSKALRTQADETSFAVGLAGVAGRIGQEHNQGSQLSFTTKVNGFFDSKTGRWQGGRRVKQNYTMPQRTFIGWTPALERELLAMAAEHFTTDVES
ncbi:phage virion morphogenesis protein [Vibrio diazotrophicus]|uniref:phage virion morphogenesis protein n=1 Tax=Vibrio diazotrophicus TaxID=685 RepID=UPI000C9DF0FD|nr:phage virion morphogenesis protein [Vibrio diazotrophicus]PNH91354.1 virion morphogenesis protein [Vibrio diazotrophicus]